MFQQALVFSSSTQLRHSKADNGGGWIWSPPFISGRQWSLYHTTSASYMRLFCRSYQ